MSELPNIVFNHVFAYFTCVLKTKCGTFQEFCPDDNDDDDNASDDDNADDDNAVDDDNDDDDDNNGDELE